MKNFQKLLAFPVSFLLAAALASPSALALAPGDLLVPVGEAVGIEMDSDGVIVSGLAAVQTDAGQVSPAGDAGLLPGDRITALNGVPIHSGEDFLAAVSALTGDPVALQADRAGGAVSFTVQPRKNTGGVWQLGLWLRDSVAGIGTVTFWDPASGLYGALGHGVCLPEGGSLMIVSGGVITRATVGSVVAGQKGLPGELCGVPAPDQILGTIESNQICGIFGRADAPLSSARAIPAASESQITLGGATILATVSADGPREYAAEITRITREPGDVRELTLTITDPALLAVTGGIVQGMSGSPILQNGRLIGAVTHVLVGDPTKGYGISLENMLAACQALDRAA